MLKLSVNYLKRFIKGERLAFILIFSGIAMAVYGILFWIGIFYGHYKMSLNGIGSPASEIQLVMDRNITMDEVKELVKLFENKAQENGMSLERIVTFHREGEVVTTGVYYPNEKSLSLLSGRNFSESEFMSGADVVIVSENYVRTLGKGEYMKLDTTGVNIEQTHYSVIGVCIFVHVDALRGKEVTMPLSTYVKNNYLSEVLTLTFAERLSEKNKAYIKALCNTQKSIEEVNLPPTIHIGEIKGMLGEMGGTVIVGFCSLISILYIISYWIERSKKRFYVYTLCGAKKVDILSIIILNTIYLFGGAAISAGVIYKVVEPSLIKYGFSHRTYWIYNVGGVILLGICVCTFSMLKSARFLKKAEFMGGKL